jgi:Kef-type K+ transport system membrane component KefB/nucleotide-binding universal stress UspA family protein
MLALAAPLPTVSGHAVFLFLIQVSLLLLAARLGAELCKRVGLPAVVGELAAGLLLGPSVLGHFAPGIAATLFPPIAAQFHLIEIVGTLGMVLLLLMTGLETDIRLLRNLGRAAAIASILGMVLPFLTGFGLGLFMPDAYLAQPDRRLLFSAFLATAMSISAMPVIAKILMDLDLTRRNIGVVILSAGVVDDTVGWMILSVIAGVASGGDINVGRILLTLGLTGAFLGLAGVVLYPLLRRLMALLARRARTPDADLTFLLVVTLLCGAATEWIGIHAVFGAFVAGVAFRQVPELKVETVKRLESFVFPVLAPIFFGTVGLRVDLTQLGDGTMLAVVLGIACLGKLVGCTLGSVWGGLRFWEGLSIAVAMNARGAMELVVATIGLSLGILNQQMFSIIVVVAIVTSFMAPIGLRLTMRKVRITEDEARRLLADQTKTLFDATQVRVLVPTVGGPNSAGAIQLGSGLSKRSTHPMEVVSVKAPISWSDRFANLFRRPSETVERPSALHRVLLDIGLPPVIREVSHTDVSSAIVEEARKGADFVIIGASSHGRWLGGPVLEQVVRRSPCHVVILKANGHDQPYRRLLVSFDGGVFSRVAVEFAVGFADVIGAEVTVAVIGSTRSNDASITSETDLDSAPIDVESLRKISPLLADGTRVNGRSLRILPLGTEQTAQASGTLAAEAGSGKYDLVIVGAENRAVQHRLFFGAETERLIRRAPTAIALVVPNIGRLG